MGPTKDKEYKIELLVANRFCDHLGSNWEILPNHRESPDFLLSNHLSTIGLELTEYRQPGAKNKSVNHNIDFERQVHDAWIGDRKVNHWSVNFIYRLTPGGEMNGCYKVPCPKERDSVIKELKELVRTIPHPQDQQVIEIRFKEDHPHLVKTRYASRYHWIDGKDFPVLYEWFESVCLTYDPELVQGWPRSNLDVGWVGVIESVLRKQIQKKLSKLPGYRRRVPAGTEIHLLIWGSGQSVIQRFAPQHTETIRRIVVEEQERSSDRFDAVWWGPDLLMDSGRKHEFVKLA